MKSIFKPKDKAIASLNMLNGNTDSFKIGGIFTVECKDAEGNVKWTEKNHNLFTTAGLNKVLDVVFGASSAAAAIYVGLMDDGGAPVAGDTMTSQTNWTEAVPYSEGARQAWTPNEGAAAGAVSNSDAKATFSINASDTVDGAFLVDDNTKSGSDGTLYCAVEFSTGRVVASGDTMTVQYDLSCADS